MNKKLFKDTKASYGKRLIAFAIDWYLGSVLVSLPVSIAYYQYVPQSATILDLRILPFSIACITLMASLLLAIMFYMVLPYRWNGQTLGKRIMKLRIQEKGKQHISWKALWLRQLLGMILIEGSVYTISPLIYQLVCYGSESLLTSITYIHYAITIVSVIYMLCNKKRCAIHDGLANTTVIAV